VWLFAQFYIHFFMSFSNVQAEHKRWKDCWEHRAITLSYLPDSVLK
jgi:hypothetical protein